MKEDFLHYVWKFQKFSTQKLFTVAGEQLSIVKPGMHNVNSGPDFFNAQLQIGDQVWAGNVEIHVSSSDWYAHHHEQDPAYDSVILHVVWQHDAEVKRKNGKAIPVLQLSTFIAPQACTNYTRLLTKADKWINCEQDFAGIDSFVLQNWLEKMFFERLEYKSHAIQEQLQQQKNHWEAVLFQMLCKNFGLKVNGDAFFSIATSIPYSVVAKCKQQPEKLEALLLGQAGLLNLEVQDPYFLQLLNDYAYMSHSYKLTTHSIIKPKYFRLRPPNFPTIRLSQIANLYAGQEHLFSKVISATSKNEFYTLFNTQAGRYWDTHYNFSITSNKRIKKLTRGFIDLLLINTVIPLKFCHAVQHGKDIVEELLDLAKSLSEEQNSIVKKFNTLRKVATNAQGSQALLHLKSFYCDRNRCLHCSIGTKIL